MGSGFYRYSPFPQNPWVEGVSNRCNLLKIRMLKMVISRIDFSNNSFKRKGDKIIVDMNVRGKTFSKTKLNNFKSYINDEKFISFKQVKDHFSLWNSHRLFS